MQPSQSSIHEHVRLDHMNRMLRLQNAATQLELLLRKTREFESSITDKAELRLDNTEQIYTIPNAG